MSFDTYYAPCAMMGYYDAENVSTLPCAYPLEGSVPAAFKSTSNCMFNNIPTVQLHESTLSCAYPLETSVPAVFKSCMLNDIPADQLRESTLPCAYPLPLEGSVPAAFKSTSNYMFNNIPTVQLHESTLSCAYPLEGSVPKTFKSRPNYMLNDMPADQLHESTLPCAYPLEGSVPAVFESTSDCIPGATREILRGCTEAYGSGDCLRSKSPFNLSDSAWSRFLFENSFDSRQDLCGHYADLPLDGATRNGDKLYCTPDHGGPASGTILASPHNDEPSPAQGPCASQLPRNNDSPATIGDGSIACQHCGRSFKRRGHLRIHSDEANFGCDVCPQRFRLKSQLRRHELLHSADNPQVCQLCGRLFRKRRHLSRHLKTHEANDNRKTLFACDVCGKQFRSKMHLAEHQMTHPATKLRGETVHQKRKRLSGESFYPHDNAAPTMKSVDLIQLCPNTKESTAFISFSPTSTEHQMVQSVAQLQGGEGQQRERLLAESFHPPDNQNPTVKSEGLIKLRPNMKDNIATANFSPTSTDGVVQQILPPSCIEYDSYSSILDSESAVHVMSTPSGFEMARPHDVHTTTSEFHAESHDIDIWYESILCLERSEEASQATCKSYVMPGEHKEYILTNL